LPVASHVVSGSSPEGKEEEEKNIFSPYYFTPTQHDHQLPPAAK
jgi:hypothetical protein